MSLLKKSLASAGIGSVRANSVIHTDQAQPGGELNGVLHVQGGDASQNIDTIGMALMTQYKRDVDDQDVYVAHVLNETRLGEGFQVAPREKRELPFSLPVPLQTPLTRGRAEVWVQTALTIPKSVAPQDRVELRIEPTPGMARVLDALEQLGFTLHQVDCAQTHLYEHDAPFVQEFEFLPGGDYAGRLTELEVIMAPDADGVEVLIEADLRAGGLAEMLLGDFDMNERFARIRIDRATWSQGSAAVASEIGQVIDSRLG